MAVEQLHLSHHYRSKRVPRRLGAFEAYVVAPDGPHNDKSCVISLVHSKLTTLNWPHLVQLQKRIVSALPGRQQAAQRQDKEALREAIHECHELQLADDLIGGWMDDLKKKNMALFSIKSQAKRFQRNAFFAAASRVLVGAQEPPLRKAKLQAAIAKAEKAELPEEDIAAAAGLLSSVEDAISREDVLNEAQGLLSALAQQSSRAAEQRDLVELQAILGAWQIDDDGDDASSGRTASGNAGTCANKPVLLLTLLAGPEYQAILKAEKVRDSLKKQVEEAERRFEGQRWDALQKAVERLQDANIQDCHLLFVMVFHNIRDHVQ
eukprot:g20165.t1